MIAIRVALAVLDLGSPAVVLFLSGRYWNDDAAFSDVVTLAMCLCWRGCEQVLQMVLDPEPDASVLSCRSAASHSVGFHVARAISSAVVRCLVLRCDA